MCHEKVRWTFYVNLIWFHFVWGGKSFYEERCSDDVFTKWCHMAESNFIRQNGRPVIVVDRNKCLVQIFHVTSSLIQTSWSSVRDICICKGFKVTTWKVNFLNMDWKCPFVVSFVKVSINLVVNPGRICFMTQGKGLF